MVSNLPDFTFDSIPDVPLPDPTLNETIEGPGDQPPLSNNGKVGFDISYFDLFGFPINSLTDIGTLTPEMIIDLLYPMDGNHLNFFLDPLGYDFDPYPYVLEWNPDNFDGIGTPLQDAESWNRQTSPTSCAVMAQLNIYESLTGYQLPEDFVCELAEEFGWFDEETGTSIANIGKILEVLGIPVETSYDCSLGDIARAIANGDEVIVGLDSLEIWEPYREVNSGLPLEQNGTGHAVWVTGLDIEPDGRVKVIMNDSGIPNGAMKAVDVADFMNAWEDSGCFMAVAETSSIAVT